MSIPSKSRATVQHAHPVADSLPGGVREARPSVSAEDVCAMPLSEFAQAKLVVEVRSDVLGEVVVFASNNALVDPGERRVVYRASELKTLAESAPSPHELRGLHRAKQIFRGSLEGN